MIRIIAALLVTTFAIGEDLIQIRDNDEAVRIALERNSLIKASSSSVAAATWRAREVLAFVGPQVAARADAGVAGGTRNNAYEAGLGERSSYGADVSINQYLFGFGRASAARRAGRANVDAAEADAAVTRRDLAFAARSAYADVLFARELILIAEARLAQRKSEQDDAAARKAQGLADGLDTTDAELRVINAAEQVEVARSAEIIALEGLAEILDLPATQLAVSGKLDRPAWLGELLTRVPAAVSTSSELKLLTAQAQQGDAVAQAEQADRLPVLSAFAGGDLSGDEVDDLDDGWSAGLQVEWAIIDGGGKRARANAARAEAQARRHETTAAERERSAQAAILLERAATLERRIEAKRQALTLSLTLYREVRERYNAGTEPLLRVNEANLSATEAAFSLADLLHQEVILAGEVARFCEVP
jgi:outer membrane protein